MNADKIVPHNDIREEAKPKHAETCASHAPQVKDWCLVSPMLSMVRSMTRACDNI